MTGETLPDDDALKAAPDNHRLLFENDEVRVLMTVVRPGETTPTHSHAYPASLYVLSWSDVVQHAPDGGVMFDSRRLPAPPPAGSALWTPAVPPHRIENVGREELRVLACEIKRADPGGAAAGLPGPPSAG